VCRVLSCVRHRSSCSEKWTSVSPWDKALHAVDALEGQTIFAPKAGAYARPDFSST
jgi:hypothetical protein